MTGTRAPFRVSTGRKISAERVMPSRSGMRTLYSAKKECFIKTALVQASTVIMQFIENATGARNAFDPPKIFKGAVRLRGILIPAVANQTRTTKRVRRIHLAQGKPQKLIGSLRVRRGISHTARIAHRPKRFVV